MCKKRFNLIQMIKVLLRAYYERDNGVQRVLFDSNFNTSQSYNVATETNANWGCTYRVSSLLVCNCQTSPGVWFSLSYIPF